MFLVKHQTLAFSCRSSVESTAMKTFVGWFALGLFLFFGGALFRGTLTQEKKKAMRSQLSPYQYVLKEEPFTLCLIRQNHGAFLEKALQSIQEQCYSNFRLIYIDNGSTDGSDQLAKERLAALFLKTPVVLHCFSEQKSMEEIAHLIEQECAPGEIVVWLKADETLAHPWVLQRLNHYFADRELFFASCAYCRVPEFLKTIDCLGGLQAERVQEISKGQKKILIPFFEIQENRKEVIPEVLSLKGF